MEGRNPQKKRERGGKEGETTKKKASVTKGNRKMVSRGQEEKIFTRCKRNLKAKRKGKKKKVAEKGKPSGKGLQHKIDQGARSGKLQKDQKIL